jgi:hypothetical protein
LPNFLKKKKKKKTQKKKKKKKKKKEPFAPTHGQEAVWSHASAEILAYLFHQR